MKYCNFSFLPPIFFSCDSVIHFPYLPSTTCSCIIVVFASRLPVPHIYIPESSFLSLFMETLNAFESPSVVRAILPSLLLPLLLFESAITEHPECFSLHRVCLLLRSTLSDGQYIVTDPFSFPHNISGDLGTVGPVWREQIAISYNSLYFNVHFVPILNH